MGEWGEFVHLKGRGRELCQRAAATWLVSMTNRWETRRSEKKIPGHRWSVLGVLWSQTCFAIGSRKYHTCIGGRYRFSFHPSTLHHLKHPYVNGRYITWTQTLVARGLSKTSQADEFCQMSNENWWKHYQFQYLHLNSRSVFLFVLGDQNFLALNSSVLISNWLKLSPTKALISTESETFWCKIISKLYSQPNKKHALCKFHSVPFQHEGISCLINICSPETGRAKTNWKFEIGMGLRIMDCGVAQV